MTKKHYILLANVIKANYNYDLLTKPQQKAVSNLAYDLAHTLKLQNARFDQDRFLIACGITK